MRIHRSGGSRADYGLYDNRHRYYDPGVGRYISADPIGQAGILAASGVAQSRLSRLPKRQRGSDSLPREGSLLEHSSRLPSAGRTLGAGLNLYTYGFDDPVNAIDPTGEIGVLAAGVIIVAAAVATYFYLDSFATFNEACREYCDAMAGAGNCPPGDTRCYVQCKEKGVGFMGAVSSEISAGVGVAIDAAGSEE